MMKSSVYIHQTKGKWMRHIILILLAVFISVSGYAQSLKSSIIESRAFLAGNGSVTSSSFVSGTGATGRVAVWGSASTITSDPSLTWSGGLLAVSGTISASVANFGTVSESVAVIASATILNGSAIRTAGISASAISLTQVQAARVIFTSAAGFTTNAGLGFTVNGTTASQMWINQASAGGTSALDVSGTISGTTISATQYVVVGSPTTPTCAGTVTRALWLNTTTGCLNYCHNGNVRQVTSVGASCT